MAEIKLWKDGEKGRLDPQLFSKVAQEKAEEIHLEDKNKNSSTQLRRFFDEIARLNSQAQTDREGDDWDIILPQVHMMVAKAAYAEGRNLVTKSFVEMFGNTIRDQVVDKDDLNAFTSFFEAFMGYYKGYRHN